MHMEEPDPHGRARWTRRLIGRGAMLVGAVLLVSALAGSTAGVRAAEEGVAPRIGVVADEVQALSRSLETARGELAVARAQVERANAVMRQSSRYQIPADLAAAIYDIAVSEGMRQDILRSYDLGANSFITKPVTFERLVDIVTTLGRYWFNIVELPGGHEPR